MSNLTHLIDPFEGFYSVKELISCTSVISIIIQKDIKRSLAYFTMSQHRKILYPYWIEIWILNPINNPFASKKEEIRGPYGKCGQEPTILFIYIYYFFLYLINMLFFFWILDVEIHFFYNESVEILLKMATKHLSRIAFCSPSSPWKEEKRKEKVPYSKWYLAFME